MIDTPFGKLLCTVGFLLLVSPVFVQESLQTPLLPVIASEHGPAPQRNERTPSPIATGFLNFEGIVIQTVPLAVKSMSGEIRQFLTVEKREPMPELKAGDLNKLTYGHTSMGNVLEGNARVVGMTIVGSIKEIAADTSWLIIRTQQPDKLENKSTYRSRQIASFSRLSRRCALATESM